MFPPSAIKPFMDVETAEKALSEAERGGVLNSHVLSVLTLDTIFPIVYATLLSGLIYRSQQVNERIWIALTPVALATWDYFENVQLALLHFSYPDNPAWLVSSALLFGKGKVIGGFVCFVILVASWGFRLFSRNDGNQADT